MQLFKKILIVFLSLAALGGAGYGIIATLRSPLFVVKHVELVNQPIHAPVEGITILELANVPLNEVNLFDLNLAEIEERILTGAPDGWIKEVELTKSFPNTLLVNVEYRKPIALWQGSDGVLSYIDKDGFVFGSVTLGFYPDLPVLSGFTGDEKFRILDGLHLLEVWHSSSVAKVTELASLIWDVERGFRVTILYPLKVGKGRTTVDLGQESEEGLSEQLHRLERVLKYLAQNTIAVRQIWADAGKKIVVKTAKGS